MRDRFHWARLLSFVTGLVNQELLLRNEYLAAENRILRAHLPARLRLSDAERFTLAEIAKRLGRQALQDIARVLKPDTLLVWYQRLVVQKFGGSRCRAYPGRPRISPDVEAMVVRLARENRSCGYDRIVGALANLSHPVSDRTVGSILRRHNLALAPERSRTATWKEFIKFHTDMLVGADFFTVEVLTWRGLMTYYVLFFIAVGRRCVSLGAITRHLNSCWMEQVARNTTMKGTGYLNVVTCCKIATGSSATSFGKRSRPTVCVHADTREKSASERPRGALGTFDQRGMPAEADPVRREVIATRCVEFSRTLSPRKKPPRQG